MINTSEFQKENHQILELQNVLSELVDKEQLLQNSIFCNLLEQFSQSVSDHLNHEDRSIYAELLNHDDKQVNELASQFITNTHELKRLMMNFVRRWCNASKQSNDHDAFVGEVKEIFDLVDSRIDLENNRLFPAIEKIATH